MKKIRIGNDFVFNWAIERGGLPEDLESVLEAKLTASVFGKKQDIPFTVSGNTITIEFTPEICNVIGLYNLLFTYILPDTSLSDKERKCAVDVDAFQIVARTAQADDPSEFTVTSDMAIAFKGDKGDSAYQVWLDAGNVGTEEDYFNWLQKPATDAGASISELEGEIQVSEGLRVQAESERDSAETARNTAESERLSAEIIRQSNEDNRIENEDTRVQNEAERISKENVRQSNETDRIEAEGIRQSNEIDRIEAEGIRAQAEVERQATIQEAITATNLANEKANLANDAAQNADEAADSALTATQEATTAASLADTARLSIQDDLALKADQADLVQLAGDVSVKIANLIENGDFRNGTTGWRYQRLVSPFSVVNGEAIYTPSDRFGGIIRDVPPFNVGDILYAASLIKTTDAQTSMYFGGGTSLIQHTGSGLYEKLSDIRTVANNTNLYSSTTTLSIDNFAETRVKYFLTVNLTQSFGKGNEPTKSEMELLLSIMGVDYFEGEITIPAQKIMQWQLALIRKNKNAIIALGGTII